MANNKEPNLDGAVTKLKTTIKKFYIELDLAVANNDQLLIAQHKHAIRECMEILEFLDVDARDFLEFAKQWRQLCQKIKLSDNN